MSDQPSDVPKHKMVDGELVELTQDEIDAIMAERAASVEAEPQPVKETKNARRTRGRG
jgi:hypothetical protein